jgi:hypothetical protein
MIAFLAATTILQYPTHSYQLEYMPESVARYCASAVGIPYASDNFSRNDWERFKECAYLQMGEQNK